MPHNRLVQQLFRPDLALQVLAGLALLLAFGSAGAVTYKVTQLTLGGSLSFANSINSSGQVAGGSRIDGDVATHAFVYSGGVLTDINAITGRTNGRAVDINDIGYIVGLSYDNPNQPRAFVYSGGTLTELGTFGGSQTAASAINNHGQFAGHSFLPDDENYHALVGTGNTMIDIGTLSPGYGSSYAAAINNSGQVSGTSDFGNDARAFLYSGGVMSNLGTLGGQHSYGAGINDLGQVTGSSNTLDPDTANAAHAFLYSAGAMTDLGTLGGFTSQSAGTAINNFGQVVGWSQMSDDDPSALHGFLYGDGTMIDLNTVLDPTTGAGWTITIATGINDSGQIIASGRKEGLGYEYGLLLTPVPEPQTYVMLLAGLAVLAGVSARRSSALAPRSGPA